MVRLLLALALVAAVVTGCSDGDDPDPAAADSDQDGGPSSGPRFCDVYLDYLAESTDGNLEAVDAAAADEQVSELVAIAVDDGAEIGRVLAAVEDLDQIARTRCQVEWTAGAQGAGSTPAAASAFFDAVVAGDPIGARNVASANAIAVFEPWEPVTADPALGTPALGEVGESSFSLVLGEASVAVCQVETGVVVACQFAE